MFPDWPQARRRLGAKLEELADDWTMRVAMAILLAVFHLALFTRAGHDRLNLPFNAAPGEAPYFANPDARATVGYPREPARWSRLIVSRWDAQHYIGTSVRGVTACPTDGDAPDIAYLDCGLGWLPAYGLAGGLVNQATGLADDLSLLLISFLCAVAVNLLWTSKTLVARMGRGPAWATLLAFNCFPTAFFMVTPYSEAATLALILAGFFALIHERWILSALAIGAATALKVSAGAFSIGLGCALLIAAWRRWRERKPRWWRPLVALPLCGWGQLATMLMLRVFVGSAWAFWRAREAFGDKHDWGRLVDPEYYLKGFAAQHMDGVMLIGTIAIVALTCRDVLKRFSLDQAVFLAVGCFITAMLVVVAPLEYWGLNRYLLLCPIAFLGMGVLAKRHTAVFVLWLLLCALFYWHVELCSYIAQGNPAICPCLGRFEFGMPFAS